MVGTWEVVLCNSRAISYGKESPADTRDKNNERTYFAA